MTGFTVFYAWQSDLHRDVGKDLIHDAANDAVVALQMGMRLEDSPRLDHDTEGISGLPSIGDTIMGKIDECSAFIADVSITGQLLGEPKKQKLMPNPNVMIELGYAWARIGWKRLILVMNKANGDQEQLPFDLRHRRFPYGYTVNHEKGSIAEERKKLAKHFAIALQAILDEEHQRVSEIIRKLDGYAMHIIRTYSTKSHFWETTAVSNSMVGSHDLAILRLLEMDVIEVRPFTGSESGFAYVWTYIGRLVLRRLQLPEPPRITMFEPASDVPPTVVTDFSMYDQILGKRPQE